MIPLTTFGTGLAPLAFLHANGYPPECYLPLLTRLGEKYTIRAMCQRPLWPDSNPAELHDWRPLAADFLQFLDEQGLQNINAIGHSMGGIAVLRAALCQPERFRRIVLIDPVLFPPHIILVWNIVRALRLDYRLHPLVPGALRRRRNFDNLEKMESGYRRKEVFRYFSNDSLRALVRGLTQPAAGKGYELRYSPAWEARIYVTSLWRDLELWQGLKTLPVPTLVIRGAETDTFLEKTGQMVVKNNPSIQVETIPQSTHLVPLEKYLETCQHILSFLEK